jgi:hypothetical protein
VSKEPLNINETVEEEVIERDFGRTQKPFNLFSPSMVGYCKRMMYNRKFSLTTMPRYVQGILHAGTVNHFWLEHNLPELFDDRAVRTEQRVKTRMETDRDFDVFVSGYADVVDSEGYVYDHKFTGDTKYVRDAPKGKDKRQVNMYIFALSDVHTGQLEYVTRDGKFLESNEVITHTFEFDEELFEKTVQNMTAVAEEVKKAERNGTEFENPFDKCEDDCYFCDKEKLKPEVKEELNRAEPHGNVEDSEEVF